MVFCPRSGRAVHVDRDMGGNKDLYSLDRALLSQPSAELAFGQTFQMLSPLAVTYASITLLGAAARAVVLLLGFPHWREWRLIMPRLAEAGYTVLAPDLRGFGLSDRPLLNFNAEPSGSLAIDGEAAS